MLSLGDEEDDDENDDEDDNNHRNHDNHTGDSTSSGGNKRNFTPDGGPPTDEGDSSSGVTGSNSEPAGLPFAGYGLPTVSPQIPAVVGNQPMPLSAQASENPPVSSGAPMRMPSVPSGSTNNTDNPVEASNPATTPGMNVGGTLSQAPITNPSNKSPTGHKANTSITISSTTETAHNPLTTPSYAFAATGTIMTTSATLPAPTTSGISSTSTAHINDSNSNTANNLQKSPVTVLMSHATSNSPGSATESVSDSVVNNTTPVTGATEKSASTTALQSATPTTTEKSQHDKTSALKEDEDSNHSSDSEGRVAAQVGSHAMNMIMSGYDPQKGQSVTASAAMNMIKDQYNNKLVDLKLSSSSLLTSTVGVTKSEIKSENNPINFNKMESTVNHSTVSMMKNDSQSTKGLLSSPAGPMSESVPSFLKKDELDLKHVNMLEGGVQPTHGPPPLIPSKTEEAQVEQSVRQEEPMEMNATDEKSSENPVQNHVLRSPQTSPKPGTPSTSVANERPSSSSQPSENASTQNLLPVSSPTADKSIASHMVGAPFGLLGAYRPYIPGVPGMQLARIPSTYMNQPVLATPAGLVAHPGLLAAGHAGLPSSAIQAAAVPQYASPFAMAGGVRYAAAHPATAYMSAAMMPTVPAATGPYSHLGVPGPDPYLAALGMGVGVPAAATAQYANPAAAAAVYPQLQMAQAHAAPQFAMISQPRIPYQGFLPRPPT